MSVSLQKGENISLEKVSPGVNSVSLGVGWDIRSSVGDDFDLDLMAFALDANDNAVSDKYFIFYNQLKSPCGGIESLGDNRTGEGDGDDEVINLELNKLDSQVSKIIFTVSIHEAEKRNQNFGQVSNAFARLFNREDSNKELLRYDLTEDYSTETILIFAELYKKDNIWKFKSVGQGFKGGLKELCQNYNISM